jgi:superfamily II DNA or RNA helicase
MSDPLEPGQVIIGHLFNEPMQVETIRQNGIDSWMVGLVGLQSEQFRRVTLTRTDIENLKILESAFSYHGDGRILRLGLQAYSLGIAYEFDPYFGLSISRVDPLPHQLEAVYDYMLKVARVRFLLADDAGAGKTIMAGLLIRELKLRGLAERTLIVCPANLSFQWQREMLEKFDERFLVLKGYDLREQFGVNQWLENNQVITSLDLAKRQDILPGLRQCRWDLVIVDEAHRMAAYSEDKKSQRYRLGELLRDRSDHIILLTATPHKGDPQNFSLFLRLLDSDAFADVRSIQEAMNRRRAPFYIRRTKEAMVYFPERQHDGTWKAREIFTRRIPHSVQFSIDGEEFKLYQEVTRYVKRQSALAAAKGDDPRSRAIGFLMSLYQRRLASSTHSMRKSLENRAKRLENMLKEARELLLTAPPVLPDPEELEEMEDLERERLEKVLEAITVSENAEQVQQEIHDLERLAEQALLVEESGTEEKLSRLEKLLHDEGFFAREDQRLLIFTEFRDTLDYLLERLGAWGFRSGCIHGGMKSGSRNEPGTRLFVEQQFKDGEIQVLVATEAAGEGINLQCCNILFNYDIPWNPNRLEQRMGRIHRYGQTKDCLIFNFVAVNTIEGRVLLKLLDKLQEIRDALDDDTVFNVVGEILPAAHLERILRDYYAGKLGDADLEERVLRDVQEDKFRNICQNALEGLATKSLNLEMLIERRAKAQERRVVPETIARFMQETSDLVPLTFKAVRQLPHTFDPPRTPPVLKNYERSPDWRLPALANKYPRLSTDREVADKNNLEWVTPGHPLFEAMRKHTFEKAREHLSQGAYFYSLGHDKPARFDFYCARVVDGLGHTISERFFAVQLMDESSPKLLDPAVLGNMQPAASPQELPLIANEPEAVTWLYEHALQPFLEEVKAERVEEIERIWQHVEVSLTELLAKEDANIGRFSDEAERGLEGAAGNLKQAEDRHAELLARRERRREELERQKALSLQKVERITSALIFPHPDREVPEVRRLRPNLETEAVAMEAAMAFEREQGRQVFDVHEKNLGYDLTSLDLHSGELRLIEVKGIGEATGTVLLTPNERRVAEDRRDCYWLYIVTDCASTPVMQEPIKDPARFPWHEVARVQHYWLEVNAMTRPMMVREDQPPYGKRD